jgi:hypothetical protein
MDAPQSCWPNNIRHIHELFKYFPLCCILMLMLIQTVHCHYCLQLLSTCGRKVVGVFMYIVSCYCPTKAASSPYRPGVKDSWRLKLPEFLDNSYMKMVRFSALRTGCLYPPFLLQPEPTPAPYRSYIFIGIIKLTSDSCITVMIYSFVLIHSVIFLF